MKHWKCIIFLIAYGEMHDLLAWKRLASLIKLLRMDFMDLLHYLQILKMFYLSLYYFGKFMQNIYDKKWFWVLWEYCGYLVIETFYETTWKWTVYFKYINLWAFDMHLPLCHDIGDYPVCVMAHLCDHLVCVTTPPVWWPVCVMTSSVWQPCHVALGEVSGFEMVLDILWLTMNNM